MSEHLTDTQINDYLDGSLSGPAGDAVAAHIDGCPRCAAELAAQRTLLERLRALPAAIEPERDLYLDIAGVLTLANRGDAAADSRARLTGTRAVPLPVDRRPLLRAAVLVGLLLGAAALAVVLRAGQEPAPVTRTVDAQFDELTRLEEQYLRAADELAREIDAQRELLGPATVALIETNMRTIDAAIAESRAALADEPGNRAVRLALLSAIERKLELLRSAAEIPTEAG